MKKELLFLLILLCTFGIKMDVFGQRTYAEGQKEALEDFLNYTPPGENNKPHYQRIMQGCTSLSDFWDSNDNYITTSEEGYITHIDWAGCMLGGTLDVTQLQHLKTLNCSNNDLVELKVDNLSKLSGLYCTYNNFTELKLNNLPALTTLRCAECGLNKLELTDLPMLAELSCFKNNLKALNLNKCNNLKNINCSFNQLEDKAFILPPKASLKRLNCYGNDALSDVFLTKLNQKYPEDGINYIYPPFTIVEIPPTIIYHTITLEVGEGIELRGLTPGALEIEEGGHLYLQFLPQDRSLTADDVILLIDGVATAFKDFGANHYFSYILNPIKADHTILILLKKTPDPDPTGNMNTNGDDTGITINKGQLTIDNATAHPIEVAVYTLTGRRTAQQRASANSTARFSLPAGTYIVRTGATTTKVMVP